MPTHKCLGPDDCENLQDKRKPAIQLDKEPAIIVREPDATRQPTPHDIQLMSKHRVLSFKRGARKARLRQVQRSPIGVVVPQRFFVHGQHAQGDRHLYASRTRFIPEKLLELFERTAWPLVPAGTAARPAGQVPKVDIGARMRGMWR
jgi:hypothetical protein